MKTMLKVTFLFAFVAFANTLFASGNLKVNILPLDAEKAVVAISTLSNSNFNITIADDQGQIVYYQENSNPGENYRKVYNFSDLEDGTYKLTVVSDDMTSERQFKKSHRIINVGEEKTTIEPYFGYEDGILRCSYLNFNKENMSLRFFKNNELIYTKDIGRNFNLQEAMNLSKLDKGNYEAVLSAGGNEYSYPIVIQ
jgi:hypothetical protein